MADRSMSLREAAAYMGVKENTLYNWRAKRMGPPSYRLNGKVVYREKELKLWMDQRHVDHERQHDQAG